LSFLQRLRCFSSASEIRFNASNIVDYPLVIEGDALTYVSPFLLMGGVGSAGTEGDGWQPDQQHECQ
jgi:hypothetical protein